MCSEAFRPGPPHAPFRVMVLSGRSPKRLPSSVKELLDADMLSDVLNAELDIDTFEGELTEILRNVSHVTYGIHDFLLSQRDDWKSFGEALNSLKMQFINTYVKHTRYLRDSSRTQAALDAAQELIDSFERGEASNIVLDHAIFAANKVLGIVPTSLSTGVATVAASGSGSKKKKQKDKKKKQQTEEQPKKKQKTDGPGEILPATQGI